MPWNKQGPWSPGPGGGSGGALPPNAVSGLALWLRADQGIAFGGMAPFVHNTGTGPLITSTGTPVATVKSIEVSILAGGAVGTATFLWSLNGVSQGSLTTAASVALGSTGVTLQFPAGTYTGSDDYTSVPCVSSWTSIDGSATVFSQVTRANMPAYIAAGLSLTGWASGPNGQAALFFTLASSQAMTATLAATVPQPYSMGIVCKMPVAASALEYVFSSASGLLVYVTAPGIIEGSSDGVTVLGIGGFDQTKTFFFSITCNGASSRLPMGGGVMGNTGVNASGTALTLGGVATAYYGGFISEVMLWGANLTASQAGGIEQYAAARYAL